jgi:hypothetical protein
VEKPQDFEERGKESWVWQMRKASMSGIRPWTPTFDPKTSYGLKLSHPYTSKNQNQGFISEQGMAHCGCSFVVSIFISKNIGCVFRPISVIKYLNI